MTQSSDSTDLMVALGEVRRLAPYAGVAENFSKRDRMDILRAYWRSSEIALDQMAGAIGNGQALPPDAAVLLAELRDFAGYLAVGKIPGPISDVAGRGNKAPGPTEVRHIRWAVTYRAAVEAGLIADGSPTQTIMEMFGVDKSTAQGWSRLFPSFSLCTDPTEIEKRARESGEFYSEAGRSAAAVGSRDGKRRGGNK